MLSTPPAFVLSQDQTLHKKVYLLPFQARSLLRRALWLFYFNLKFQSILLEFKDFFGRFRDLSLFWLRHCSVLKDLCPLNAPRSARFAIVSFALPFVNTFFGTFFPAHCVSQPLLVSLSESFIRLPFFLVVVKKKRIKKPAALSWIVLTGLLPKSSFCRQFTFVIIIYLFLI